MEATCENGVAFFKAKATRRKERKDIVSLKAQDGTIFQESTIFSEFMQFFNFLFSSQMDVDHINWNAELGGFQTKVTDIMHARLIKPYIKKKIRRALFEMSPEKAPGMDGFSAVFYQRFWHLVKAKVCKEVLDFLNDG